jgi:hypothetical protein
VRIQKQSIAHDSHALRVSNRYDVATIEKQNVEYGVHGFEYTEVLEYWSILMMVSEYRVSNSAYE